MKHTPLKEYATLRKRKGDQTPPLQSSLAVLADRKRRLLLHLLPPVLFAVLFASLRLLTFPHVLSASLRLLQFPPNRFALLRFVVYRMLFKIALSLQLACHARMYGAGWLWKDHGEVLGRDERRERMVLHEPKYFSLYRKIVTHLCCPLLFDLHHFAHVTEGITHHAAHYAGQPLKLEMRDRVAEALTVHWYQVFWMSWTMDEFPYHPLDLSSWTIKRLTSPGLG